jgi:hypothetical protein
VRFHVGLFHADGADVQARAFRLGIARQCQTNANQTAKCAKRIASGRQLTPLGQGGRTVLFEDVAAVEVTVVVEVVVD